MRCELGIARPTTTVASIPETMHHMLDDCDVLQKPQQTRSGGESEQAGNSPRLHSGNVDDGNAERSPSNSTTLHSLTYRYDGIGNSHVRYWVRRDLLVHVIQASTSFPPLERRLVYEAHGRRASCAHQWRLLHGNEAGKRTKVREESSVVPREHICREAGTKPRSLDPPSSRAHPASVRGGGHSVSISANSSNDIPRN